MTRRLTAEFLGTAILVFIGVGTATLVFGFGAALGASGTRAGAGLAAGLLTVAMAFGLTLLALARVIGPVSGCHVNPAVTLGALLARRIGAAQAAGYAVAQFAGGTLGALVLFWLLNSSPLYRKAAQGLGANGWGPDSMLHVSAGGAALAEIVLTAILVFVVLTVSRPGEPAALAGVPVGLTLAAAHLLGIAIDGTSVNPARSLGPALITGGLPLRQAWLFIVAPLAGAALAAAAHLYLYPVAQPRDEPVIPQGDRVAVIAEG